MDKRPDRKLGALMASHCACHCGDLLGYEQLGNPLIYDIASRGP